MGARQYGTLLTGKELFTPFGPTGDTSEAVFTPDGKYLAVSAESLYVWDAATGQPFLTYSIGSIGDLNAALTPGCVAPPTAPFDWCGVYLATSNRDDTIKLWDISPTGNRELLTVPGLWHCINRDATELVTYTSAITTTQNYRWQLPPATSPASAADAFTIPGQELSTSAGANFDSYPDVAFSADCNRSATVNDATGEITITDVSNGKELLKFKQAEGTKRTARVTTLDFSPDGTRLATVGPENTAKVYDLTNGGKELLTLIGHTGPVDWVRFSPDGKRLATSSRDSTAKVWDAETGKEIYTLTGHTAAVGGIAFSPDRYTPRDRKFGRGCEGMGHEYRERAAEPDRTHLECVGTSI